MLRIVSILRAAHCRSTHHYFAVDGLSHVQSDRGQRLALILLKYHDQYLQGAKAPDTEFRDFKNHVFHVNDNGWGGAVEACVKWYQITLDQLNRGNWRKAAYACGVLSHYFTDPMMPLHTGQSEREGQIHRPMEWSICKAYDEIWRLSHSQTMTAELPPVAEADWLSHSVRQGAVLAHSFYDSLIDGYQLEIGCQDPPAGLDPAAKQILAILFRAVLSRWGQVLDRVAEESVANLPTVNLNLTTLLATIDIPLAWVVGKISDLSERHAVRQLLREYQHTGSVTRHLPSEVLAVQAAKHVRPVTTEASDAAPMDEMVVILEQSSNADREMISESPVSPSSDLLSVVDDATSTNDQPNSTKEDLEQPDVASVDDDESIVVSPAVPPLPVSLSRLNITSNIVDAPSIGEKTAERLREVGVMTVGDLLSADADTLSQKLGTNWITAELVEIWQHQAKLVCDVPALCGYKSQLLVAAGCRAKSQLALSRPATLHGQVIQVCQSENGKRILRSAKLPTLDDITQWIDSARSTLSRSAA
ncbi:MAG: DUF4332 domain-containing protein [Planctomycetales bacterium]|nr:DUF4332 domain-containing protein [Planctomycetales bacterium]